MMIFENRFCHSSDDMRYYFTDSAAIEKMSVVVCQKIVSLPERIANVCSGRGVAEGFQTEKYLLRIAVAAVKTLESIRRRIG